MIKVIAPNEYKLASKLVLAATQRSVTKTQCELIVVDEIEECTGILIAISPNEIMGRKIIDWIQKNPRKLILFGTLPDILIDFLELKKTSWPDTPNDWHKSLPAPLHEYSESVGVVQYQKLMERFQLKPWRRPMVRFDFADEWNNMGYGAICFDNSIWSVAVPLIAKKPNELASLKIGNESCFTYASLHDTDQYSVLWFNRHVGPIDSFEWRVVETFIAHYRYSSHPCYPVIKEIPWGFDSAITMRLDCDENIASASKLFEAYKHMNVPFSLAIHTGSIDHERDQFILQDVIEHKGSLLSHSCTHAPNWGGNYENARKEASASKEIIEKIVGVKVRYAVSPFHQSPSYALRALSEEEYDGCVGGIIRNDPEFLMARGGSLADIDPNFIGHSQQVMLHGDCMLKTEDPLKIYKESFDLAYESQTLFGFLDHPFSERYQYGWLNEASRIEKHFDFMSYIKTKARQPIFLSEEDALSFIKYKSMVSVSQYEDKFHITLPKIKSPITLAFAIEFRNQTVKACDGVILS